MHVGHARFEGNDFGVEGAEFALHAKGPGFVGAATGDHASLIGGAVGCHESVLRIFAGEFFRGGSAVSEIGTSQSGQKLFGGGAERIAEFDEFVETRVNAVFSAERNDRLVIGDLEIFGGVDEESGAAADFVAQEGDAGASVIKSFDHDVFEFIAEILFDGRFVVLGDFGVIGEHTDGAEIVAGATFVGGEKFLHGVGGVGAVVQNLGKSGVARADRGQRIA